MCTVVVSLEPGERMPLLLLGIRDELLDRPWLPPARHWRDLPLIGGRDEQAGGTWLAVHPAIPRVACVLNAHGHPAPEPFRKSRGDLPLLAGAGGRPAVDGLDPGAYDPFHLVVADTASIDMLSWDGVRAKRTTLGPGTHMIVNAGLDPADAKVRYFAAKFAATRPLAAPTTEPADAWGGWTRLAEGNGLPETDPRAIRVRHKLPDGRAYGSSSVSLVALSTQGIRYDFAAIPGTAKPVAL